MSTTDSVAGGRLSPEGRALIEWFNFLPSSGPSAITVDDLTDGSNIWTALQQLDSDFFSGPLPEEAVRGTGRWLSAWGNLKHIYKYLVDYAGKSNGRLPSGPGSADLKRIAKGGEPEETIKARLMRETTNQDETNYSMQLLQLLLFIAIHARENQHFIEAITMLAEEKQVLLQNAIVGFQQDVQADEGTGTIRPVSVDKDLFFEEQVGRLTQESNRLTQEKRELQRDLQDLHDRNSRLQGHNNSLQQKLTAAEERLEDSAGNVGESFLKDIENKVHQQEELIATQEAQLADAQHIIDSLKTENNKFKGLHEKYQPLQDEFDEIKAERDQLLRKANAIDKYKQKLHTMQDTEKENNNLRNALEESRELNQEGNKALDRVKVLQTTIDEYKKVIPTIEQELHEQRMLRKQSEYRSEELGNQLAEANDQYQRDQDRIAELIDQMQSGANPSEGGGRLENELSKDTSQENEFADIKAQNEQLAKSNNERDGRIAMLESMLAVAKQRNANLEERLDETLRKPTNGIEGDGARREAERAELEQERAVFQRKLTEEAEKGKQYTNFAAVMEEMAENGDIVVVNRSELRKLQESQGAAEELQAKGAENLELQRRIKDLETQVKQHQTMLSEAIGGPDAEETLKLVEAAAKGSTTMPSADKQVVDTQVSWLLEQNEQQEREISGLKEQIAQIRAAPGAMKASEQLAIKQENEAIKRENRLMTSAFFDLSSRLQLNNVSLQRRSEPPKSWVNRQRQLVSQATAVRTRS